MNPHVRVPIPLTAARAGKGKRPQFWHNAILDLLMANPMISQGEIARQLGKAQSTISLIMSSDLFKDALAQRKQAQNEILDEEIRHRLLKVTDKTLSAIEEKVDRGRDKLALNSLADLASMTLQSLGYGPKGAGTTVNVNAGQANVAVVERSELAAARQMMRDRQQAMLRDVTPPATRSTGLATSSSLPSAVGGEGEGDGG